jgi:CheY-like chemotaxis protein
MRDFLAGRKRPVATRVLVVEDDPAVRAVIKRGLEREGYEVLEESGETRIDFEALPRVDVLVADVGLPAETGDDVAERCIRQWPHCEVILLTGHEPNELRERGVRTDLDVLQKPVLPRTLADLVYKRLTLRGWRALRTDQDRL